MKNKFARMDMCRICLSTKANTDIFQLQIDKNDNSKSYDHIMLFCLDIQVEQNSKMTTKLCTRCSKKLIGFDKFKTLALKNDAYLKSLDVKVTVKNEVFIKDNVQVKTEPTVSEASSKDDIGDDILIKLENPEVHESDDEFLSVIKKIKYEYIEDDNGNINDAPIEYGENTKRKYKSRKKQDHKTSGLKMCEECGKTVKDLTAHMMTHLPGDKRELFKCKFCDKMFKNRHSRYKHNKFKHLGVKQKCPICNKVVAHLKQHHRIVHEPSTLQHECLLCQRRFTCNSKLEVHMTSHTKDRPIPCDMCDKKFTSKALMTMHRRQVHEKEKSHLCQLCSKSFFKKYHLQIHLRSHSKEKPYKCPDCGKCFSSTSILKSHRLIHNTERKYACEHCDMTFVKQCYLRVHMISHTKEKRHPCQYCGVRFGRSDHRKRHEYTAHLKHLVNFKADNISTKDMTNNTCNRILMQGLEVVDTTE